MISLVVTYPIDKVPTAQSLEDRLAHLQTVWPHLHAQIVDADATPSWAAGTPCSLVRAGESSSKDLEGMLREENQYKDGPMLQVTRYTSHLGFTIRHELADGIGALRLVHAILSTETFSPESTPPPLEDVVNLKVPTLSLLGILFDKLVLGKIWPTPVWPETKPTGSNRLSLISLSSSLLDRVEAARKIHAPTTSIHAVITTAWTLALQSVVGPATFTAGTPRSERQASYCLGNYVTSSAFRFTPHILQQPFWQIATQVGLSLKTGTDKARQNVGMLAYVPAGWKEYWQEEAGKPYGDSWELSNLGKTTLPAGALDMAWAQPAPVVGAAMNVSALRHSGGMRLCVTWKDGLCDIPAVTQEFIRLLD